MGVSRFFVTGASGFVGGAIVRHLRSLGHEVVGTVNSRRVDASDVVLDVRDAASWAAMPPGDVDVVIHSAALMGPQRFDRRTRATNVDGTVHALAFARERRASHFVQISTIAAYGLRCIGQERREATTALSTARFHPAETEYMRSKAEAERRVEASGVPFTTLRLPVILGAGSTFAAPAILGKLAIGQADFVRKKDGRVSVLCLDNLAPMLDSVIEHGPALRAYNVGDGHLPWCDLVAIYGHALGREIPWRRRTMLDFLLRSTDPYAMFWLSNGLMGAHFPSDDFDRERPWTRRVSIEDAVRAEVASHAATDRPGAR